MPAWIYKDAVSTDAHTPRLLSDSDAAADLAGVARPVSLPPLPEAVTVNAAPHDSRWQWNAYTGTQMRDYARAAIANVASERDALAVRVRELEAEREGHAFTHSDPDLDDLLNRAALLAQGRGGMDLGIAFLDALERVEARLAAASEGKKRTQTATSGDTERLSEARNRELTRGMLWGIADDIGDARDKALDAALTTPESKP